MDIHNLTTKSNKIISEQAIELLSMITATEVQNK